MADTPGNNEKKGRPRKDSVKPRQAKPSLDEGASDKPLRPKKHFTFTPQTGDSDRPRRTGSKDSSTGKDWKDSKRDLSERPYKKAGESSGGKGRKDIKRDSSDRPYKKAGDTFGDKDWKDSKRDSSERSYKNDGDTTDGKKFNRGRGDGSEGKFSKSKDEDRFEKGGKGSYKERGSRRYDDGAPKKEFGGEKKFNSDRPVRFKSQEDRKSEGRGRGRDDKFSRKDNIVEWSGESLKTPEFGRSNKPARIYVKKARKPTLQEQDGKIRLNKYIANAGVCSRREADDLIKSGAIKVNGKIVTELGYRISPEDRVQYGDESLSSEGKKYLLLNKPKDYITTSNDPEGRKTVMELVKNACKERLYPVGRLDRATTGLLLMTNDGDLAKKLTHPSHQVKKVYQVTLDKNLKAVDLKKIAEGVTLEDGLAEVDEISYVGEGNAKNEVGVVLHSGKNRIVRRIFEHLGYEVVKLDRTYFAGLTKKDLPRGKFRFLTDKEVAMLKMV